VVWHDAPLSSDVPAESGGGGPRASKSRGLSLIPERLTESEARRRSGLTEAWPFGKVELHSDGRVSREEPTRVLVGLVHRSRHLIYSKRPELFSQDIARIVSVKRRLLNEELVIAWRGNPALYELRCGFASAPSRTRSQRNQPILKLKVGSGVRPRVSKV
jgi:hypothetical protein